MKLSGIEERRGKLICDGTEIDSEVIYWKIVPSDEFFESPITPHHDLHHDRYITFEYDQGKFMNHFANVILPVAYVYLHP